MTEKFSGNKKAEFAHLESRPDLFETKILRLKSTTECDRTLLVATRDPGSGNAVLPVLKELAHDSGLRIDVLTDGNAQEKIQDNFDTEDISPEHMMLASENVLSPDVVLIDRSDNMGIEMYAVATFPDIPTILIEDYYSSSLHFLTELKNRNLPFPVKICVADESAKDLIIETLPELKDVVEVTGQPALDRFPSEDTEGLSLEIKTRLGLSKEDKLVSFMSTIDGLEKVGLMAQALRKAGGDYHLAFRRHPRDGVSYEEYEQLLLDAGIRVIDTTILTTDEVNIASDIILTTWSTEGLHGIYRGKPTVHIIDLDFPIPEGLALPLPQVSTGSSIGLDNIEDLEQVLPKLLDSESLANQELSKNIKEHYHLDGKNAERVANVVRNYL